MLSQQSKEALMVLGVEERAARTYTEPNIDRFFSDDTMKLLLGGQNFTGRIIQTAKQINVPLVILLRVSRCMYEEAIKNDLYLDYDLERWNS